MPAAEAERRQNVSSVLTKAPHGLSEWVAADHRPGRQRSERRPEAGHAPLPSLPERLLHQLALGGRIHAPEAAFPRLVLRAGDFQEVAVEREVVSDGVLEKDMTRTFGERGRRPAALL